MTEHWIRPRPMGNADAEYDRMRELEDAREEAVAALKKATEPTVRLCKDCAHYQAGNCVAANNMQVSLVDGAPRTRYMPNTLRSYEDECGKEAKWFAPIELKVAA
jgi:hypothetical protein